jgi:hypothetical protein
VLSNPVTAVACPTADSCIASDKVGVISWTSDALSSSPQWTAATTYTLGTPSAFDCPRARLCYAVDGNGTVYSTNSPETSFVGWSHDQIDNTNNGSGAEANFMTGLSCPTSGLCVALDRGGNAFTSTSPTSASWTESTVAPSDTGDRAYISCPTTSFCEAVNAAGYGWFDPATGAWQGVNVINGSTAPYGFSGIACPSTTLCIAAISNSSGGDALYVSTHPTSPAWSIVNLSTVKLPSPAPFVGQSSGLAGVACATVRLCLAITGAVVFTTTDPGGSASSWTGALLPTHSALKAVSCNSSGTCIVEAGNTVWTAHFSVPTGPAPAPSPTTVTSSTSTASPSAEHDPGYAAAKRFWRAGDSASTAGQDTLWHEAATALQNGGIHSNDDAIAYSDLSSLQALPLDPTTAAPQKTKDVTFLDAYFGTPGLYG